MKQDPAVVFRAAAKRRCRQIAERVVAHIRAPEHTGRLERGYRVRDTANGAEVVNRWWYWKYVEFGTSQQGAQPHVRPAIEAVRSEP